MGITIEDLLDLFVDREQMIRVYDLENDANCIYEGDGREIPYDIECLEISSIDNIYPDNDGYVGINVSIDEDEE